MKNVQITTKERRFSTKKMDVRPIFDVFFGGKRKLNLSILHAKNGCPAMKGIDFILFSGTPRLGVPTLPVKGLDTFKRRPAGRHAPKSFVCLHEFV